MSNSVDTRTTQPRGNTSASGSPSDEFTLLLIGIDDPTAKAGYTDHTSRLSDLYRHCRESCTDTASLRIVATSALVVGLMLSSAPAALAQIRHLLATTPSALTLDDSTHDEPARDASTQDDLTRSAADAPANTDVPHRSTVRSALALISWNGTSQAVRCAYGLLIEGNTRNCGSELALASSQGKLVA